jgi:hypothetical protein
MRMLLAAATSGATTMAMNWKPVHRWKYGTDASTGIASKCSG